MATVNMTKKDFVAIQTAIFDARMATAYASGQSPQASRIFDSMAKDIATVLAKQNPKFDRAAFLKGCGVGM